MAPGLIRGIRSIVPAGALVLAACALPAPERPAAGVPPCATMAACDARADDAEALLAAAYRFEQRAARARRERGAVHNAVHCALQAYRAMAASTGADTQAAELSTRCTDQALGRVLARARRWSEGRTRLADVDIEVEFRRLSPLLGDTLALTRAADVPVEIFRGDRFLTPGVGVPLAVQTPRCSDGPLCALLPPEGVFRWATAWLEAGAHAGDRPRLVIADPVALGELTVGTQRYPLAADTSAFYARGVQQSKLRRLAILGLLGGDELGRRAGLYLLDDYDPNKRPLIMIHGLGSSPLIWARLSNAIWGDPSLRARFQVWHVVYRTEAPMLITRARVQGYLDAAWRVLDPDGDDPARRGLVLIGHSLGGVIARLLSVDSGEVLWNAAFAVRPEALPGDPADVDGVVRALRFGRYPGVARAIFIAAPHHGSPAADSRLGRFVRYLVGPSAPEIQSLRRIARAHPEVVREDVRVLFQRARLNSISTLRPDQPVSRANHALLPAADIPYHTIAGALPGRRPETDGVVPLASARLPGAASTLIVPAGHDVYESDEAVAEVLRILHADLAAR